MQHFKKYRSQEIRAIFFRGPGENPRGGSDDAIEGNTQKRFRFNGLGPLMARQEEAGIDAARRLGCRTYTEYHQKIRLRDGEKEKEGQHVFQAHLSENPDQPKTIIFVLEGNVNTLSKRLGIDQLYRQLIAQHGKNCDIVKLRVGNTLLGNTLNPNINNDVLFQHIKNVWQDALHGRGIFSGRRYTSIACVGYSYGGGAIDAMVNNSKIWRAINPKGIPLVATAYIDGVRFGGIRGIDQAPTQSQNHYHCWQGTRDVRCGGICGAPLQTMRSDKDQSIPISAANHFRINEPHNDQASQTMYDSILKFIEEKAELGKK